MNKNEMQELDAWHVNITEPALSALIPPMILQQLVENAVKHGVAQQTTGGEIKISAQQTPGGLELRVENTGSLKPSLNHKGFGIENVRERLRLLCGAAASFDLRNISEDRVAATARIPLTATL